MLRALVTGGAGFIGSHVAELFHRRGYDVDVMDDLSTGKRANLPDGVRLLQLDIGSAEAARLLEQASYDVVAHLAAQIDVRRSVADPAWDAQVNILGTLNLLEALRRNPQGAKCRFVFASTGGALYGDFATPPSPEDTEKNPEAPYGITKCTVEYYLAYYARVHGLDTVSARFGNVYGPRQDPHGEAGVVAIFCGRILDGSSLTVFGDGTQTRDYVFVADVANAVMRAATAALPNPGRLDARAFNIGTGEGTSVLRLAEVLRQVSRTSVVVEHAPKRPGEMQDSVLSVSKAREVLGWRPQVTLEQGLARTFEWFAERHPVARRAS